MPVRNQLSSYSLHFLLIKTMISPALEFIRSEL